MIIIHIASRISGIKAIRTQSTGGAAFSAYVSTYETELSKDHIIKFDTVVSNSGSHYNRHFGLFTVPEQGVYGFSWNLYCQGGGYIYSHLMVNSNVVGATYSSGDGANGIRTTTGVVVVQVNAGDMYVRTPQMVIITYSVIQTGDHLSVVGKCFKTRKCHLALLIKISFLCEHICWLLYKTQYIIERALLINRELTIRKKWKLKAINANNQ